MGLDHYIRDINGKEVQYWRKEYAIHEFFFNIWKTRINLDGKEEDFNCIKVPLVTDDFENLKSFIALSLIDNPDPYGIHDPHKFDKLIELSKTQQLYYDSWW